jgi:ribosomal protein S18 acetylase RimI-like enzyme
VFDFGGNAVRLLTTSDLDRAVYVQSRAFQTDPLWQYLIPNPEKRAVLLPKFFRVFLKASIHCSQAYGVRNPVEGLATWCSPRQRRFEFSGFFLVGLPRLIFGGFFVPFLRALKVLSQTERLQRRIASDSHYYLNTLAVSPESQGRGLASKLVRPFLEKAAEETAGVYVETMALRNVGLYEHLGFQLVGFCSMPSASVSIYAFYIPPKRKSQTK